MSEKIPYYRVAHKTARAYWCPTIKMKAAGFHTVTLGDDGEEARATARMWNLRWRDFRKTAAKKAANSREPKPAFERRIARSFVYFVEIGNLIKIGFSRSPFRRIRDVTGGAPEKFGRILIVPGSQADEQHLHHTYARYRTGGEWFMAASPVLLEMFRAARLGRIETDGLRVEDRTNPRVRVEAEAIS